MPVTARFVADFNNLYAAVQKTEVVLTGLEGSARKVGRELNTMTESLSGKKIVTDAAVILKAIDNIGGTSKLTATELQRLGPTASEAIDKMKRIGIEVPPELQKVADAAKKADQPTQSLGVSFTKLVGSFITAQAIIGAVKTGFHAVTGFISDSVKAANEAEKANVQLTAALKAQGTATPNVVAAFSRYADELQRTTVFQDDAAKAAAALLVQVGNVMPRDMEKALQATANLASGLGVDLQSAAMNVAKAAEGQTGALKRSGIVIDETKVKAQGFGVVLDAINEKFGGQSAAIAGTYQGRLTQLKNSWNDLQESVGRLITTNETLLSLFGHLNTGLGENKDALEKNRQAVNFVSDSVLVTVKAFGLFAKSLDFVQLFGNAALVWLREGGIKVLQFAELSVKASRAMALMTGNIAGVQIANEALTQINAAVAARRDLIAQDTDRSIRWGNALQEVAFKADKLAEELAVTRGRTVQLTTATDTNTNAWARNTRAATDASKAAKTWKEDAGAFIGPTLAAKDAFDKLEEASRKLDTVREAFNRQTPAVEGAKTEIEFYIHTLAAMRHEATLTADQLGRLLATIESGTFSGPMAGVPMIPGQDLIPKQGAVSSFLVKSLTQIGTGMLRGVGDMILGTLSRLMQQANVDLDKFVTLTKARMDFIGAAGGIKELEQQATKAGFALDEMLKTNKIEVFEREVKALQKALAFQEQTINDLDDAVERWGFSFEELGPALQRQRLDERAQTLLKDFRLLTGAGIDVGTVLGKMGGSFNELVRQSTQFGIALPSTLRKAVDEMARLGLLTDEAGNAFASAEDAGVTFTDDLSQGMKSLAKSIDDMVAALGRFLDLATEAERKANNIRLAPGIIAGGVGDTLGGLFGATGGRVTARGIQAFGLGGTVLPFRGSDTVPAMLSPGEVVLNSNQQKAVSALMHGGGGVTEITTYVVLDGHIAGKSVERYQNSRLRTRTRVRAA